MIDWSEILTLLTEFQGCQKMLSAIGDEARQHIIIQMLASNHSGEARCGGMRVGEIAALSSLSRPAISHHLQILKDAGLLKMSRSSSANRWRRACKFFSNAFCSEVVSACFLRFISAITARSSMAISLAFSRMSPRIKSEKTLCKVLCGDQAPLPPLE